MLLLCASPFHDGTCSIHVFNGSLLRRITGQHYISTFEQAVQSVDQALLLKLVVHSMLRTSRTAAPMPGMLLANTLGKKWHTPALPDLLPSCLVCVFT